MRAELRVGAGSRESRSQAASPARAPPGAGAAPPLFEPGRQSAGARPRAAPLRSAPAPRAARTAPQAIPRRGLLQHRRLPPAAAFKPSGTHHPRGCRPRPRAPPAPRRAGGTDRRGAPGVGTAAKPRRTHTPTLGRGTGHRAPGSPPPVPPRLVRPGRTRPPTRRKGAGRGRGWGRQGAPRLAGLRRPRGLGGSPNRGDRGTGLFPGGGYGLRGGAVPWGVVESPGSWSLQNYSDPRLVVASGRCPQVVVTPGPCPRDHYHCKMRTLEFW